MNLVKYDEACAEIAAAKQVDEVKQIRDVSLAMQTYARQAKNHQLEADAIEIRMRATRRMDQMRQEQKITVGLASGKEGKRKALGFSKNPSDRPTLAEAGINKNLAHEGRKLGALSEREFAKAVTTARDAVGAPRMAFRGLVARDWHGSRRRQPLPDQRYQRHHKPRRRVDRRRRLRPVFVGNRANVAAGA
jgi:hypothetical protein